MTATAADRIEFYRGQPPAPLSRLGPSIWPYQSSERRVRGRWQPKLEPSIPVILHGPLNWTTVPGALLDSGADTTAIPYEWAGPLGVDLERAKSLTAFANGVHAEYLHPSERLSAEIAGRVIRLDPIFGPWPNLILGRDVFDHFRVIFDQRAEQVILDPYEG